MSAYDVVYSALTGNAELMTLVPASRIQRYYVRDGVSMPAISYRRSSTRYYEVIHAARPPGADVVMEIICVSDSESQIDAIGDAVELALGNASLRVLDREDLGDPDTQLFATVISVEAFTQH